MNRETSPRSANARGTPGGERWGVAWATAYSRLQGLLPQHLLSRTVHWLARIELAWFKNLWILAFARLFGVDRSVLARPVPRGYGSFNDFFTRELAPSARPLAPGDDTVLSPADSAVSAVGILSGERMVQAKSRTFTLSALLAGDAALVEKCTGGNYVTLYLAPPDYHRIHMPLAGTLREMILVPGRLFSVGSITARGMSDLYARNERVICTFETAAGTMILVLVGALMVGSIETVWHGEVTPGSGRDLRRWRYGETGREHVELARGAELGRFNMGSTVILLFPPASVMWDATLHPGVTVRIGQRLARRVPQIAL